MPVLANAKWEAVARALLADPQAVGWRAYKSVYQECSRRAAETGFTRLMKNAEFAARVAELKAAAAEGVVLTAREVLEGLSLLAQSNMQDYVGDNDIETPVQSLTREQAACIQERTVEYYTEGRGDDAREVKRVKTKLYDRRAALVDLGRYYGLFKDRQEISLSVTLEQLIARSYQKIEDAK
jgi:phage terminase small subunit